MIVRDNGITLQCLPGRQMRLILENFLKSQGWQIETPSGSSKLPDLEARLNDLKWIITLRGLNQNAADPSETFVAVLGEILQRMDSPCNKYSIALPDTLPFERLWRRLSPEAKQRTAISALFVNSRGYVREED